MRHRRGIVTSLALVAASLLLACAAYARVLVRIDAEQGDSQLDRNAGLVGGKPVEWLDGLIPHLGLSDLSAAQLEVVGGKAGQWVDVLMPEDLVNDLATARLDYSIITWDDDAEPPDIASTYWTLDRFEQILHQIAEDYPDITKLYVIGESCQGRPIWCLEITDNPGLDEGEPGAFYTGAPPRFRMADVGDLPLPGGPPNVSVRL